jgi:hypothetical protein
MVQSRAAAPSAWDKTLMRHKARLNTKGYMHPLGTDFDNEVHFPCREFVQWIIFLVQPGAEIAP